MVKLVGIMSVVALIYGSSSIIQAILRSLYAYFADKPLKEVPHIEVLFSTYSLSFAVTRSKNTLE